MLRTRGPAACVKDGHEALARPGLLGLTLVLAACGGEVASETTTASTTTSTSTTSATTTTVDDDDAHDDNRGGDDYDDRTPHNDHYRRRHHYHQRPPRRPLPQLPPLRLPPTTTTAPPGGSTVTIGTRTSAFSPATVTIKRGRHSPMGSERREPHHHLRCRSHPGWPLESGHYGRCPGVGHL